MNNRERKEIFAINNVLVSYSGPLKDEVLFEGKLSLIQESHGLEIEWLPLKLKTSDVKSGSPDVDSLDWEEVTSSVGYKANHNDSIDAVEIKSVNVPKPIKFDLLDLNSYKKTEVPDSTKTVVTFLLKDGTNVPAFQFQNSDFGKFCAALDNFTHFRRSKKEKNLYLVVDPKVDVVDRKVEVVDPKVDALFSELDLFSESKQPYILNMIHDPYNTALGGFSKVTNYLLEHVIYGNGTGSQAHDSSLSDMLTESILNIKIDALEEPGYELITCIELPPRPDILREDPVTLEEWNSFVDSEGRIANSDALKRRIFKGGLVHSVRSEAWKYLLGFYSFDATNKDKGLIKKKREEDYFRMKLQWMSIDADQESRFSALRERKSLIGKDVSRTDRTHPFYEGENNPNLQMLQDILMTYCMYNFDLGYVQGMSDLLSPILVVMQNELEAFWCFAGWLEKIGVNFELEQQGMKNQLQDLHRLLHFVDSQLCSYLEKHESGNLYFAFRWLLILFKRDFKFMEIMRLWEVLWTELPCKNFHLLICIAILDSEKTTIMENEYGLSEILKHINEMSYKINLDDTLSKAEAIYLQIKNSKYQSDIVQSILGIEPTTPPPPPPPPLPEASKKTKPVVRPIKPPGFAVPVNREDNSERTSNSSENIDEYVDLEQHYRLQFDLFS